MINELLFGGIMYFSASQNQDYVTKQGYWAENNSVVVEYDFDKNGKTDVYGIFKVMKKERDSYITSDYASIVMLDEDEDGIVDIIYVDSDNNGSLETKLIKIDNVRST